MIINIFVHPNSKKPRVEKDILGQLNVYVAALPIEGKANNAVIEALAKYFKVRKNDVRLIAGQKSKLKLFEIENM